MSNQEKRGFRYWKPQVSAKSMTSPMSLAQSSTLPIVTKIRSYISQSKTPSSKWSKTFTSKFNSRLRALTRLANKKFLGVFVRRARIISSRLFVRKQSNNKTPAESLQRSQKLPIRLTLILSVIFNSHPWLVRLTLRLALRNILQICLVSWSPLSVTQYQLPNRRGSLRSSNKCLRLICRRCSFRRSSICKANICNQMSTKLTGIWWKSIRDRSQNSATCRDSKNTKNRFITTPP